MRSPPAALPTAATSSSDARASARPRGSIPLAVARPHCTGSCRPVAVRCIHRGVCVRHSQPLLSRRHFGCDRSANDNEHRRPPPRWGGGPRCRLAGRGRRLTSSARPLLVCPPRGCETAGAAAVAKALSVLLVRASSPLALVGARSGTGGGSGGPKQKHPVRRNSKTVATSEGAESCTSTLAASTAPPAARAFASFASGAVRRRSPLAQPLPDGAQGGRSLRGALYDPPGAEILLDLDCQH